MRTHFPGDPPPFALSSSKGVLLKSVVVFLCLSCGNQFPPETLVDDLRVLSVVAEPPEVGPGETSTLSVTFADPAKPGVTKTVLWVGCEPDPQDLGRSACNDATILLKPTTITDYPPGLKLLGFGPKTSYASTSTVFDVLPSDSPVRQRGTIGQVLGLVIGEAVDPLATGEQLRGYFERIEKKETPAVVGLSRVIVSEKPVAERNMNPRISKLLIDGVELPTGARLAVLPGQEVQLKVDVPDGNRETYVEQQPSGPVTKTEQLVGAWYSTKGRFSRERFDAAAGVTTTFIAPGSTKFPDDTVPEKRNAALWLVLRDNRGGQASATHSMFICDAALPTPAVTDVQLEGSRVVVTGSNVDALLDVVVGGAALVGGNYDSTRRAFIGDLPMLASGTYDVSAKAKSCANVMVSQRLTVP